MADVNHILAQCDNVLPGHGRRQSIVEQLRQVADGLSASDYGDSYGEGAYLQAFEEEVADLFGKAAAVFMPSGTMAQQIALRVWCDRTGRRTIAMHPSAHLEFAEHLGYQYLHDIKRLQFGSPEFAADRMPTLDDFEKLGAVPGAALIELPCRPLGGQLPDWDEFVGIRDWLSARQVPFHLDGARIWQCTSFYAKTLAEIAASFDSVYVSFYKDVGALCGCMLLGDEDFIAECRVWQRRYGGNLYTQSPFYASARLQLAATLPRMDLWVEKAIELASLLTQHDAIAIKPDPPHVNFFRAYLKGEAEALTERHHQLAEETGNFLFHRLTPAPVPGFATTEIHCWENAESFDVSRLPDFLDRLFDAGPV